jgi:hypothetical protein
MVGRVVLDGSEMAREAWTVTLSFFDAESDIFVIRFAISDDPDGERRPWGMLMRDFGSSSALSAELWSASRFVPVSLLEVMPGLAEAASDRSCDFAHFDRLAGSVWLRTGESMVPYSTERAWGLTIQDRVTDAVVAIELRDAREHLPGDLLRFMPAPLAG